MNQQANLAEFHEQLKPVLPRLRIYALALTRDADAADDLLHDTVMRALTHRAQFKRGSNLAAWLFRIQRNEFLSGLRRQRVTVPVDSAIAEALSHPPHQESHVATSEFIAAFRKLPEGQRESLLRAILEGESYEAIARATGVLIGTVKSRISRARRSLERMLNDDAPPLPRGPHPKPVMIGTQSKDDWNAGIAVALHTTRPIVQATGRPSLKRPCLR